MGLHGWALCLLCPAEQVASMCQHGGRGVFAGHHFGQFDNARLAGERLHAGEGLAILVGADDILGNLQVMIGAGGNLRQVGDADDLVGAVAVVG